MNRTKGVTNGTEQELFLSVGGVGLRLVSRLELSVSDKLEPFRVPPTGDAVTITVSPLERDPGFSAARPCGEDTHFFYRRDEAHFYAATRPAAGGVSDAVTVCAPDSWEGTVYLNLRDFPKLRPSADLALQMYPLRSLLFHHRALVLHSSRVLAGGRAIVFSAPSQTGKTTQARLWAKYGGGETVSNDKSILRLEEGGCFTYGYPVDGSSPVFDNRRIPLGAAVVLAQGGENRVERLSPLSAVRYLTAQTLSVPLADTGELARFWLEVAAICPVYRLTCTPDRGAVDCLREQLERDGVIFNG